MSCPHGQRSDATTCSSCLGIVPSVSRKIEIPEGQLLDEELIPRSLTADEERHREVSRRGGNAHAQARRSKLSPRETVSVVARARFGERTPEQIVEMARRRRDRAIANAPAGCCSIEAYAEQTGIKLSTARSRVKRNMVPVLRVEGHVWIQMASEVAS